MPSTTIHIPDDLLHQVDSRAKALGLSRNRFILQAIENTLEEDDAWSPGFIEELSRPRTKGEIEAVDEMLEHIIASRRSKKEPPTF